MIHLTLKLKDYSVSKNNIFDTNVPGQKSKFRLSREEMMAEHKVFTS